MASVGIVLIYERFAAALKKKKSAVQASQQYEVQKYNLAELKSHEIKSLIFVFCSFNHSRNPQFVGLELKQV